MSVREFLSFKKFIAVPSITIIYLIGFFLITLGASILMGMGIWALILPNNVALMLPLFGVWSGVLYFLAGLILLIGGNILWRLYCEYTVIQFRIYEALVSIDRKISPASTTPSPIRLSAERQPGTLFSSTTQSS